MGFTLLFLPTLQNLALLSTITARELLGIIHVTIYIIAILSFSKYCCQADALRQPYEIHAEM